MKIFTVVDRFQALGTDFPEDVRTQIFKTFDEAKAYMDASIKGLDSKYGYGYTMLSPTFAVVRDNPTYDHSITIESTEI